MVYSARTISESIHIKFKVTTAKRDCATKRLPSVLRKDIEPTPVR
jgi:hypothetical protein